MKITDKRGELLNVTVIFTCFNRKEKTIKCIKSLQEQNRNHLLSFVIVDDNSSDGTVEGIQALDCKSLVLEGDGNLFWAGGMRKGIETFFQTDANSDYVLLVNDDVEFYDDIISSLITRSKENSDAIIVGATCDSGGRYTYGASRLLKNNKRGLYCAVEPSDEIIFCDIFNCNCVLIKSGIMKLLGNFDSTYTHALADFDYGFHAKKNQIPILSSGDYVGICEKNSIKNTWQDKSLSCWTRLRKKESIKGAPFKPWFYYMKKNHGLAKAIRYSISPYIRIFLKK